MRLGQYAQLRYGSAWLDLPNLAAAITETGIEPRVCEPHLRRHLPAHAVANGHLTTSCARPWIAAST